MRRTLLALLLAFGSAAPASAYVRAQNKLGQPVFWRGGCIFLTPTAGGSTDLGEARSLEQLRVSIGRWTTATASCSYLALEVDAPASEGGAKYDMKNRVTWIESRWGTTEDDGDYVPYDVQAAALTTIHFIESKDSPDNGQILDADIELNGVNFTFAVVGEAARPGVVVTDVQNTLVHELGHLVGLDHTCNDDTSRRPAPIDDQGGAVPACSPQNRLPASITDATMFNFADPGETKKRIPQADDQRAWCEIYPAAADPGSCEPVNRGTRKPGCATAPGASGSLAWLLLLPLLLVTARACSRIRRS
jgi:hypothetical protein